VILGLSARIFSSCSFIRRSRRSCKWEGWGEKHRTEPLTTTWPRHRGAGKQQRKEASSTQQAHQYNSGEVADVCLPPT
jgi:hypothetical protein